MPQHDRNPVNNREGHPECWEELPCGVCSGEKKERLYPAAVDPNEDIRSMFWCLHSKQKRRKFHAAINRCIDCGHIYSSPYLKEEILNDCYSNSHFDNSWQLESEFLLSTAKHYLEQAMPFLPDTGCMMDIGCDLGFLLEAASQAGFQKIIGMEPNKTASDRAQIRLGSYPQVTIRNETYSNEAISPESFSLISFIQVLDHIKQPSAILGTVFRDLKPRGVVIAVTHNIKSLLARLTGRRFPPLNLQHPQFFSPSSLRLLFEKAGLEFLKICPTLNTYPLNHYIRYAPLLPESAKNRLIPWLGKSLGSYPLSLPLGNMMIIARKPS